MRPRLLAVIKYIWASPVIAVGLLAALVSLMFGEPMHWRDGALTIHAGGPLGRRMKARGWGGFTLGITVFLWSWEDPRIEYHERVHVRQVLAWGPLFPLIYFVSLAIHGYRKNVFESEAYRETDEHWTPRA
jgi:hypothetical protein